MAFLDPHAVTGGTGTAAQQRREVYKQCKGNTGVDHAGDLKVVAVPGSPGVAGISVGGGSVAVESRREAYSILNLAMDGDALVDVPSAGSGGATHYVIVEVHDPEFDGQVVGTVPQVVSSLSGRTRPYLPLARIDLEPGESFDATSSITDLRRVSVPRIERTVRGHSLGNTQGGDLTSEASGGQEWPQLGLDWWRVDIPEWATRVTVVAHWAGVRLRSVPDRHGTLRVRLGDGSNYFETSLTRWNLDDTAATVAREFWTLSSVRSIPEDMRGATNVPVSGRGRVDNPGSTSPTGAGPRMDGGSSFTVDLQFSEEPV